MLRMRPDMRSELATDEMMSFIPPWMASGDDDEEADDEDEDEDDDEDEAEETDDE